MKKIIALALVLTMVFSMALTVSAEETIVGSDSLPQTPSAPVDIKITVNGSIVDQYAFDIEYGSLTFTFGATLEWNPDSYEYEPVGSDGVWSANNDADKITVINHSNQPIYTAAKVESTTTEYGKLTLKVSEGGMIEGCKVGDSKGDRKLTLTVSVEGDPIVSEASAAKIGSVVVTVSQNPITNQQ